MMQIYLISGRLVVAKDATQAKGKAGVAYKASVMNLTPKLKALCQQVLGDQVFDGEHSISVQALRREEEEHAHTRRLLEEQSTSYRDVFDRHQKLSRELIAANGRVGSLEKDLVQATARAGTLKAKISELTASDDKQRAEIERLRALLKQADQKTPHPAVVQADATRRFLEGQDIGAETETSAPIDDTPSLSAMAQKHGKSVMQLLDLGHNPDEVVQEINARLPLNDHITTGIVKKIKVEMTQALRARNQATLKAKRA